MAAGASGSSRGGERWGAPTPTPERTPEFSAWMPSTWDFVWFGVSGEIFSEAVEAGRGAAEASQGQDLPRPPPEGTAEFFQWETSVSMNFNCSDCTSLGI